MDELPSVALVNVLDHLPYRDLIRCRLVNKLWRYLIHRSVSKRELILFIETHPQVHLWKHSGETVNLENSIQVNFSVFESETFYELFKSVKSLFLSFNYFFLRNQELVDNLARNFSDTLENLQIDYQSMGTLELDRKLNLTLKNLKTVCFSREPNHPIGPHWYFDLTLDFVRLTHFYTHTDLAFEHDTLIARIAPNLRVLFANWISYAYPLEFPNLERFGCCNAPGTQYLVSGLPNLKEFYFATHFTTNSTEAKEPIREFLIEIERQNKNVDVFWFGMKFTLENLDRNLDAFIIIGKSGPGIGLKTLNYFKENSPILNFDYLPYTGEPALIYFDSFVNLFDEKADRELIKKLRINLRTVFMREFKQEFDVPKLANLFYSVSTVLISQTSPKQTQFNILPMIFPNLRSLFLGPSSPVDTDFSFIFKLKNLYLLRVACLVPVEVLDQALINCKRLHLGAFGPIENRYIFTVGYRYISLPENRFDLRVFSICQLTPIYFKEKEELFEYLDKNNLIFKP